MRHFYRTRGVCSSAIEFDIEDGSIHDVVFHGGCNGNLKGISKLVEGRDPREIVAMLEGNTCGRKPTSCPDQLACALKEALAEEQQLG